MSKIISLILITFLVIVTPSFAVISDKDQKKFDEDLTKIHQRNENYRKRKEELRKSDYKNKIEKKETKEKYNHILEENRKKAYEHKLKEAERNRSKAKEGDLYLDEVKGGYIRK